VAYLAPEGEQSGHLGDDQAVALADPTVVVNAAGFVRRGSLARSSPEDVEGLVGANLMATMWSCKYMLPALLRQKQILSKVETGDEMNDMRAIRSPCIVNVSSLLASHSGAGAVVYSAAKAGVIGKIKSDIC
jgi:NAD(P)-dependent dehydrogenase (short-subunit alcohol dehydrogenase family)